MRYVPAKMTKAIHTTGKWNNHSSILRPRLLIEPSPYKDPQGYTAGTLMEGSRSGRLRSKFCAGRLWSICGGTRCDGDLYG